MNDLSISQAYLLCTLNKNGKFPVLSAEVPVCFLASAVMDLVISGSAVIEDKKKICITGELKEEYEYLESLYSFIKKSKTNSMKIDKLASEYALTLSDKRIRMLTEAVSATLYRKGCMTEEQIGRFSAKPSYIPKPEAIDRVVQNIRKQILKDKDMTEETAALISLLNKSGHLKKYFTKDENVQLKNCIKEIKTAPSNQLVKQMLETMETMLMMFMVFAISSSNHN